MSGTYVGHNVAKLTAGHFVGGAGDFISMGSALAKCEALEEVQQKYFHDTSEYKGGAIAENDALQAIKYARSKKLTKAKRKGVLGAGKFGAFVVGAAAGATVGSVVPVAGTVAGGAIGAVSLSAVAGVGLTIGDRTKRFAKFLYKKAKGTQGEHRDQAAHALFYCFTHLHSGPAGAAAEEALEIILQEEYEAVMRSNDPVKRISERLKSN